MELKNYNVHFFLLTLLGISAVTFFIFQPFLLAIIMAAILAVIFQRPYNFFLRLTGGRAHFSAFLIAILGIVIFAGLFAGIVGLVVSESTALYQSATSGSGLLGQTSINNLLVHIKNNPLLESLGLSGLVNSQTISQSMSQLAQGALAVFQKTYQSIANFLFFTVVTFFTLYYFLIDGKELVKRIIYLSPLRDTHEKLLVGKFISMSRATIKGNLIIALIQGTIGGVLFTSVGIHSAVIWGVAMMFCSLLPGPGTSLIWLPVGITMIVLGSVWQGIVILAVGASIISLVDNFLSPKLIGKDTQMHPLLVFFAILGGIGMFGFLGFIIGPVILALFLTMWDIYAVEFKRQLKKYNA